jgi:hypothetical protein
MAELDSLPEQPFLQSGTPVVFPEAVSAIGLFSDETTSLIA